MNYLKEKLKEKNISQKELAKRTGITDGRISQIINGKTKCSIRIDTAYNIANVLDVDIEEFIEEILK